MFNNTFGYAATGNGGNTFGGTWGNPWANVPSFWYQGPWNQGPWNQQPGNFGMQAPQAINPWLLLAWLNQFNPYANAFAQQPTNAGFAMTPANPFAEFPWQAFWNGSPGNQYSNQFAAHQFANNQFANSQPMGIPMQPQASMPMPNGFNSNGFFATNFFSSTPQQYGQPFGHAPVQSNQSGYNGTNYQTPSYPQTPGYPTNNNSQPNAYPQFPGVPSFFNATPNMPMTPSNPLEEPLAPKRSASRNGV
jgi:hypothetical protein